MTSAIDNLTSAAGAAAITPSDAQTIVPTRGVYVGAAGDLKVEMLDGTVVTFSSLAQGVVHPLTVVKVYETGTTATGIVALR